MVTAARQVPIQRRVETAQVRPKQSQKKLSTAATHAPALTIPAPQAELRQPSMPYNAPQMVQQPSLMTKIWHGAEGILVAIGHACAAAGAWAGRGFGSMLGW
jgi:hypothetical protein